MRHTGPTVMPVSFADSSDLGEGRLTDNIMLTIDMWRGLVKTIVVKNYEFTAHRATKKDDFLPFCCSYSLQHEQIRSIGPN